MLLHGAIAAGVEMVVGADIVVLIIKNKNKTLGLLRVWPSLWLPLACDAKVAGVATVGLVIAES